jgi:acyl transferase domain-containing protein
MKPQIVLSGLACRFAGAPSKDTFWDLVRRNRVAVAELPPHRWNSRDWFANAADMMRYQTIPGGYIEGLEQFDAQFFGINPREALLMDPQQRLLLQAAWHALEDAGLRARSLRGSRVGIFVGAMTNDWAHIYLGDANALSSQTVTGNGFALLANRISYLLDLKGPSLTLDSACSSSLLAVHYACRALRDDECDIAVAASANAIVTPTLQRFYERAGLAAPDGRCKPFSRRADGIGRGEGVGAIVLQRASEASQSYGTVMGSAINHNGRSNGLTAPSRRAQCAVLEAAWRNAEVTASDIDEIECHGTGTALGDQIELAALHELLDGRKAAAACRLGAVKGLIGHTESASGMAGLIKAALMLRHRHSPANPFATEPTTALPETGPAALAGSARNYGALRPFVIGVSALGLGGTNAHVVLEATSSPGTAPEERAPRLITLAADDAEAVERQRADLAEFVAAGHVPLRDIAATARSVRIDGPHRLAIVATDGAEAARKLRSPVRNLDRGDARRRIVFLFSGQGVQYPAMGRALARRFPAFRDSLEQSFEIVRRLGGENIRPVFRDETPGSLRRASVAQPALFAFELAMADTLRDLGVQPDVVIGHSIGEFAAACVAGAYDATQCLRMLIARGALIDAYGGDGGMLSLRAVEPDVEALLDAVPSLCVAVRNSPSDIVLSGPAAAVEAAAEYCARMGIRARRLPVTHGFHSPLMQPVAALLRERCSAETPSALRIPMLSTVTAAYISAPPDAEYWARHLAAQVRFADACRKLAQAEEPWLGLELGPRASLAPLAEQQIAEAGVWLACASARPDDTGPFLESIGAAWQLGCPVNLLALREAEARHVPLPPYPFAKTAFWHRPIDAPPAVPAAAADQLPAAAADHAADRRPQAGGHSTAVAIAILAQVVGIDAARILPDHRIAEDLGLDSVNVIEVIGRLREAIGADALPPLETLMGVATVGDLTGLLSA